MASPNMATITASLERSLQNCSLNNRRSPASDDLSPDPSAEADADAPSLELNSQGSLPFHWEQCLDLKTGEVYYINWMTGMRAKEDPRSSAEEHGGGGGEYSDDDDDSSSYGSQDSSSESSPSSSREQWSGNSNQNNYYYHQQEEKDENSSSSSVLVVAGCKSCLMYYMVPKQLEICPKCSGHLLHFDRSGNSSSS